MFIHHEGAFLSFTEFMLSESIRMKEIKYGTDPKTSNGKIEKEGKMLWTVFEKKGTYFFMMYDTTTGVAGFGASDTWTGDMMGDLDKFTNQRTMSFQAFTVFGHAFYVLMKMVDKANSSVIKFDGADNKLDGAYDRMVKNKPFMQDIEDKGWVYKGKIKNQHTFVKNR